MNTFNVTGSLNGAPPSAATSMLAAAPPSGQATSEFLASPIPSRDSQIAGLSDVSSSVNSLQQAASVQQTASSQIDDNSAEPLLELPALPPMPAPKAAPAVPVDDHGQSNIVFSDADADGSLIR